METMKQIIAILPPFDIESKSRKVKDVSIRMVFCYLSHRAGFSYSEIGRFIHRKHNTVIHSVRRINDLIYVRDKMTLDLIELTRAAQ